MTASTSPTTRVSSTSVQTATARASAAVTTVDPCGPSAHRVCHADWRKGKKESIQPQDGGACRTAEPSGSIHSGCGCASYTDHKVMYVYGLANRIGLVSCCRSCLKPPICVVVKFNQAIPNEIYSLPISCMALMISCSRIFDGFLKPLI